MPDQPSFRNRVFLTPLAAGVVLYCLYTLAIVATVPDLRLRFLLIDDPATQPVAANTELKPAGPELNRPGIVVRDTDGVELRGSLIQPGDRLVLLGDIPIRTYLDFAREILRLRTMKISPGGDNANGTDPLQPGLPALIQEESGKRWIRVRFHQEATGQEVVSAIALQSVPLSEAALTFVWFLLELVIFGVGLLAFWSRPFDRSAKVFFAMCSATLGAFVGGFHWWVMVGSFWLSVPFVICAVLLPVIVLHFFLIYPRPRLLVQRYPKSTLAAIYAVPVATLILYLGVEILLWQRLIEPDSPARTEAVLMWLQMIRQGIYFYLAVAAIYFLATLGSLVFVRITTRNPVELNQVNFILWAGMIATAFIGYTLYLAYFYRTEFALGGGRLPMFLASLVFMLAYAIGIVRFKLMLVEQMVSRGMLYYLLSYGSTALVAAGIAAGAMAVSHQNHVLPSNLQAVLVAGILMIGVAMIIWLRDGWQQAIDRRFFREKYRLDKALRRMNRTEGQLTDTQMLAERMLNSCREVLQADRAALYLRIDKMMVWRLTSAQGNVQGLPYQLPVNDDVLQIMAREGTVQRALAGLDASSPDQELLRQLHAELIHSLEMDGLISGFVALGTKPNNASYSAEDLTFLTALGEMTGVALQNAKVQQDLGHLNEELRLRMERIAQQKQQILMLQAELTATRAEPRLESTDEFQRELIAGNSPALTRVLETVRKVAASETAVLLRGESGTGKELVAHVIHNNSSRRNGPMITVHCAALSPGLLESELFGHVKGAYSGAHTDRPGRFELASGGIIFLDEIGDISLETQVKLLRVLQQREFERVGGTETIRVDVRVIAATHQNLEQLIAEGKFREDLYYRLNVISVTLPPLRERLEDLLELSMRFLKRASARSGKSVIGMDDDAVDLLMKYSWPGNIRELENVIERAVVLADGATVTPTDLPADLQDMTRTSVRQSPKTPRPVNRPAAVSAPAYARKSLDDVSERELLLSALQKCHGNKASAARMLGIPRSTFFSKLKKHAIAE